MIQEKYQELCRKQSDINEHLPTLSRYAEGKDVIELGVRAIVSTWAFLAGRPKSLISIDIKHPAEYGGDLFAAEIAAFEEGVHFQFHLGDTLKIDLPACDVLFIDTLHTYDQLTQELARHHMKAREYIILHDTNLPEDDQMQRAVNDFLDNFPEWEIAETFENNNGLTVLKRV